MELTRRAFAKLLALAALPRPRLPRRPRFPGRLRPLDPRRVRKPGPWGG